MSYTKVIGFFPDPAAADHAKAALIRARLADESTMWTEPESLSQDVHPPRPRPGVLRWIKDAIAGAEPPATDNPDLGRVALIVTVRDTLSGAVRDALSDAVSGRDSSEIAIRFQRDPHVERQSEQREVLRSATGAARELDS
jgi:hypothetical protein